ncbi:glycosyltransferase [Cryobacterium luteum]|uniref:glycosyltransferase n=1 Tax=Cryobacterium luteum TaxID=1424661 RepID=UPI0008CD22AB|nr:glycosyltransferase [Cryobacterium luteum]SEN94054.1 CDP-glycerol glycerophosphotransferase, TagB/SpsB family [Cryobacterium luteum]
MTVRTDPRAPTAGRPLATPPAVTPPAVTLTLFARLLAACARALAGPRRRLAGLAGRIRRAWRYEVHAFWRARAINSNAVLYEAFNGSGMLCNPEALFRQLRETPDQARLRHIWALKNPRAARRDFRGDRTVRFVKSGSSAYYRALATSRYLISNATFPPQFSKRPGQIYLNTWHGTPLKHMGYDMVDGAFGTANIVRNFVSADYLLAANPFMARQMYERAYKLDGIFAGRMLLAGYPRIDRQTLSPEQSRAARARLAGLNLGDREIVLYAPTWKGASFAHPDDDLDALLDRVRQIEQGIDSTRYVVLLKTHQAVHALAAGRADLARVLVPNDLPTNVVLGLTSILVTDYSSIFFDFLATGRPIVFFTPDLADFEQARGLYLAPTELPGPVCRTAAAVAAVIGEVADHGRLPAFTQRYRVAQHDYVGQDDGAASARVIDIVFRGADPARALHESPRPARTSVLIYLGGMKPNGITSAALNLLGAVDHDRFDVSVAFAKSNAPARRASQRLVDPRVRQFARIGGMNGGVWQRLVRRHRGAPARAFAAEFTRCFGDSRFDHVIDFSGYGPFWAELLLHSPPAVRSIWLHNDLAADAHRSVGGAKRMLRGLTATFTRYERYDSLVSVSPALAEINARDLAAYAPQSKFTVAHNTVDVERILRGAAATEPATELEAEPADPNAASAESATDSAASALSAAGPRAAEQESARSGIFAPETDVTTTTFVTIGRLSPEKNQARLIRAFALVHARHPLTRLVIVGGGPLKAELSALIRDLNLSTAVILTGPLANPFPVLAAADCFVLSSDYEGAPMVILEALVLGRAVVTVAFASVHDALPHAAGLVVPQTDAGLAAGLTAFLRGEVAAGAFDHEAYVRRAVAEFYRAIGVPDDLDAELAELAPIERLAKR